MADVEGHNGDDDDKCHNIIAMYKKKYIYIDLKINDRNEDLVGAT